MIIIHTLSNFDSYFRLYLVILCHDIRQKKAPLTLSELTKTLEDEQIHLSNENKRTANYTRRSKSKKAKPSEQKRGGMEKRSNNEREKKRQEVNGFKICGGKH